ncbi:MAG: hypothetical protein KDB90_11360 [Planctomycetes bacterium]|nr:hypothetical protein [Planctomycetota bacterium]
MIKRNWLFAASAAVLLACVVVHLGAQPAIDPDEGEIVFVNREYELQGLFDGSENSDDGPRDLVATCFYASLNPKKGASEEDLLGWNHIRCEGGGLVSDEKELTDLCKSLSDPAEFGSAIIAYKPGPFLVVSASASLHSRLTAALDYLREMMQARIQVQIRRIDALPERLVQSREQVSGQLITSREISNGEFALVSNVTQSPIVWTGVAEMNGDVPQVASYYWGEQWGISALIMSDGRIRMQAWHGGVVNNGLRELATRTGKLQLPTAHWDATPAGAIVPNGGGLVLDTAAGAYLITASTTAKITHRKLDDGITSFWNPGGAIPAGRFTGPWLLSATGELSREMDPPVFLPQGVDDRELFLAAYPAIPGAGSAFVLDELTHDMTGNDSYVYPFTCGSLFGLRRAEVPERENDEQVQALRAALEPTVEEICRGPSHHEVRVRILRLPREARIPAGVVGGKPEAGDIAALVALAEVESVFDRRVSLASRQLSDLVEMKLENYMAGFDSWSSGADAGPKHYSTKVATHATGVQVRLVADHNGHVHVVAGWRYDSEMHQFKPGGDLEGETIERPEWKDVTLIVADIVKSGGALSAVQPVDDDTVAVLIVERREAK